MKNAVKQFVVSVLLASVILAVLAHSSSAQYANTMELSDGTFVQVKNGLHGSGSGHAVAGSGLGQRGAGEELYVAEESFSVDFACVLLGHSIFGLQEVCVPGVSLASSVSPPYPGGLPKRW